MKIAKFMLVATTLTTLCTTNAIATPISVALNALKFVAGRTTSVATTFAVAHTVGGTGAPGSGGCGPRISITGAPVSCNSSDFFPHPPPPTVVGNDVAISSAFGTSWALGFGGIATANASASKGDFAAAGAYARGGAAASAIAGSLAATGLTKASTSFSLGGLTISGSKDPSNSFYGFVVSDQEPTTLNQDLLEESIFGISLDSFIPTPTSSGFNIGLPNNIFYALLLNLDGASGKLDVLNFGLSVTSPLTNIDFEDISTTDESIFRLKGSGDFTIDIPFLDLNAPEQIITFDEMRLDVAAVPEPATILLLGTGIAGIIGSRTKNRKSNRTTLRT